MWEMQKKFPFIKEKNLIFLPKILIILLKRFTYNVETNDNINENIKLNNYFEFPLELSLNNDFDVIRQTKEKIENNYKYNLFGIILHEGTSNNWHYTSIVKDITKTWKYFDDKNVYNIDIAKLKKLSFGVDNDDAFIYENNSNAYLLFYKKKNDLYFEQFLR